MLPNCSISYDGLSQIPFVKNYFKNVTLNHAYTCTYGVSSFSTYSTWVAAGDGLGFVRDVLTNLPYPSSMYDVTGVTLTESFNPLIRINCTLNNGLTLKGEMRRTRTLNLSISGGQVIQANQDQITLGSSYKLSQFHPSGFLKDSKLNNDLNVSANLTYKNQHALLRKIEENYSQASSGTKGMVLELMADYVISRNLNLSVFYDYESTIPLVSSYPVSTSDFGFSLRFSLNR
jgi:cell surface protein SprA